jgi:hypothetical protein
MNRKGFGCSLDIFGINRKGFGCSLNIFGNNGRRSCKSRIFPNGETDVRPQSYDSPKKSSEVPSKRSIATNKSRNVRPFVRICSEEK